ncbi:hypothetical protein EHQ23_05895 [Leptospira bourretii]|uniref:Cell envelope biogenesis protein OmpA n=1 Tax=Leptospira bourretii TaxID=2484962 RepID=A0A4R9IK39_9LEPT|nr:hypothetical protein EHQ23_05895 [Leptospira bourretii]TGK89226.1 hypothetical protein EHQ26_18420 [Leptospira bourretii]TGL21481.1 hypothetical protein EHQ47_11025 [Leptospira bourretii]TGL29698.1 hypothetical protein EHQ45_14920 [Leptospira bourretii]
MRTFRVLFLLPIYHSQSFEATSNGYVIETKSYAKPLDIIITTLGFLFSVNSSTDYIRSCPWEQVEKSMKGNGDGENNLEKSKLAFWKPVGSSEPIESIFFESDDYRLNEESINKLVVLGQKILKPEEKVQVILYGKVNTVGDVGFQIRLLKRRYDEIKSKLSKESSIDTNSIIPIIGEKENSADSKSNSTIQIYLLKN